MPREKLKTPISKPISSSPSSPATMSTTPNPHKEEDNPKIQTLETLHSQSPTTNHHPPPPPPPEDDQDEPEGTPLSPSLSNHITTRKQHQSKRNKKLGHKKRALIEKKLQTLTKTLNPLPFVPNKNLDFNKHENLFRKLGLWDFVHIEFDRVIRVDLIAQLIVNYTPSSRCSYVNDARIQVNRSDLARALKLPVKKEKLEKLDIVDCDLEIDEIEVSFVEEFVSSWVLLHDDAWIMPSEVLNWKRFIKDGVPEKVDWAGLIWFMVEKEVIQGEKLGNCYYASYLQYLIKCQREEVFGQDSSVVVVGVSVEKEDDGDGDGDGEARGNGLEEENIKLSLGQGNVEKENHVGDEGNMGIEENGKWVLGEKSGDGTNGVDFLQGCSLGDDHDGEIKQEGDDGFNISPKCDVLHGLSSANLVQEMEASEIPFTTPVGVRQFTHARKREISREYDDHDMGHKRPRNDEQWNQKPSEFDVCIEQMHNVMEKMRMVYEAEEEGSEELTTKQQMLVSEIQQRDSLIEALQKGKYEELNKRHTEIYRLEREAYLMGNLLEGYRKALQDTHQAFSEYRALVHETVQKDVDTEDIVMSTVELEKQPLKQEDDEMNQSMIMEKMKDFEEGWFSKFEVLNDTQLLSDRLASFEEEVKRLKELVSKRKNPEVPERAADE